MDLMTRRRSLLARVESEPGLNTSPRIAQYGVKNPSGNPATKPYIEDANYCVTVIYSYTSSASRQTLELYGGNGNIILYADGTYKDYWNFNGESQPHRWNVINANTNGISCSLKISMLADSYAFMVETGEILFAGRNSIYYGHRNINDLN